ncbi:hypothetical protein [Dongshaea marina]|uniref:hypothetical protein n=1 Tax=Dongshaea marina TaxID=2047966 RepID=UPI000D3E309D|nr:hypothetical protein [Dongshaea marina]
MTHTRIQQALIYRLYWFSGILALPALIVTLLYSQFIGFRLGVSLNMAVIIFVLCLLPILKRSPYNLKVMGLLLFMTIITFLDYFAWGTLVTLQRTLLIMILVSNLFWSKKGVLLTIIYTMLLMSLISYISINHPFSLNISDHLNMSQSGSWFYLGFSFFTIVIPFVIATTDIAQQLTRKVSELRTANIQLKQSNQKLQAAYNQISKLHGILPICAQCKSIRDDEGYWQQVESYIEKNSEATFSHCLCESCTDKLYGHESWYQKS